MSILYFLPGLEPSKIGLFCNNILSLITVYEPATHTYNHHLIRLTAHVMHENTDQCHHTMFPQLIHSANTSGRTVRHYEGILSTRKADSFGYFTTLFQLHSFIPQNEKKIEALALRDVTRRSLRDGLFTVCSYISVPSSRVKALPQAVTNYQPTSRNIEEERIPQL